MAIRTLTPMGPGFFILFQQERVVHLPPQEGDFVSYDQPVSLEEREMIEMLIMIMVAIWKR